MVMFLRIDASIRSLACFLVYWSEDVNFYPKGGFKVLQLCKWNESLLWLHSASQSIHHLSNAKIVQKYSTFQLSFPLHLICSQTAVKQMQEDYFDKPFLKTEFKTRTLWSSLFMSNKWYSATHCWGTSESLLAFKLCCIIFSEECLVTVSNSLE